MWNVAARILAPHVNLQKFDCQDLQQVFGCGPHVECTACVLAPCRPSIGQYSVLLGSQQTMNVQSACSLSQAFSFLLLSFNLHFTCIPCLQDKIHMSSNLGHFVHFRLFLPFNLKIPKHNNYHKKRHKICLKNSKHLCK